MNLKPALSALQKYLIHPNYGMWLICIFLMTVDLSSRHDTVSQLEKHPDGNLRFNCSIRSYISSHGNQILICTSSKIDELGMEWISKCVAAWLWFIRKSDYSCNRTPHEQIQVPHPQSHIKCIEPHPCFFTLKQSSCPQEFPIFFLEFFSSNFSWYHNDSKLTNVLP